ncbi:MAG TPA: response regulator transcription factor [Bacteroidales bacterium]|nr:response regulator transcription factor [Bacteroidales bacterium]HRT89752.1 response regulator transcription factor [Bacteroidales bacterium]
MIKVLITDDHPVVRQGIKMILESDPARSFGPIDEASSGQEMMNKLVTSGYDIIVLDISMPGRSGLDLLGDIKKGWPEISVVILSMHPEEQYAIKALKMGASAYLTKTSATEELISCLLKVREGGRYITRSLAEKISMAVLDETEKPVTEKLSARELEVVTLLASGKTISAIAGELSLSPKTISTYRERILEKLKLKTTSDIIRFALKEGLV